MSTKSDRDALFNLADALAQDIAAAPGEEILAEAAEDYGNHRAPAIYNSLPGLQPPDAGTSTTSSTVAYVVELKPEPSEAEAYRSFSHMRSIFPKELGGREALIRHDDNDPGSNNYIATIGPFDSEAGAEFLCNKIRSDGENCIVRKTDAPASR